MRRAYLRAAVRRSPGAALCLIAAGLAAAGTASAAQTGSSIIIDRDRPDRRPPAPAPRPPSPSGAAAIRAASPPVKPFVIRGVRLEHASGPAALFDQAFRPFIGRTASAAELDRVADAAAGAYAKTDVALYTVVLPNQDFAGGVVRLRVIEGFIQDVAVNDAGKAAKDLPRVRAIASRLLGERPLRKSSFQRAILLIRDIPGLTAEVQLLRGHGPGAVRLVLAVKRKPFELGVGINDRGTSELGRTQVDAELTANGLFRAGDQTRFTVVLPTEIERFQYYAASHMEPLTDDGLSATASIGYLRTRPASVPIEGSAATAGLALSYPLIRSNDRNLTLTGSIDGVNSDDALLGQVLSDDRTRAFRAAAAYSRTIDKITYAVSGAASFGLDILGARVTSPLLSDQTFKKISGRAGVDDRITPEWTARLRAMGQYSGDRLPAAEQLALGGDEFGRAFESAIVIGDSGVGGSLELAYAPKALPRAIRGSEVYGFVDGGELWNHDRVIVPAQSFALSSSGLGVRFVATVKTVLQIEASKALEVPYPGTPNSWRVVVGYRTRY